ncbi:hypothetical protein HMPREF9140_01376 [Prevotella micans F0438]|uniref:Uncharacterized protein n=1 Tax=Prevotella micans F0438 TaxID=883158 RepID=H1Q388_9BACT|nr:hypothetical protein HMPREF9140_01376 [Prevotella micans F0438]
MCVLPQLMYSSPIGVCASSIDVFVIQSNPTRAAGPHVGTDPVSVRLHDPTRMLLVVFCLPPTPTRAADCITHIGFIKSYMPSVLRTEGVIFGQTRGLSLHAGLQPELDLGY